MLLLYVALSIASAQAAAAAPIRYCVVGDVLCMFDFSNVFMCLLVAFLLACCCIVDLISYGLQNLPNARRIRPIDLN